MFSKFFNSEEKQVSESEIKPAEKSSVSKETYIKRVMKATDWTEKDTVQRIEALKKQTGIKYREYCNYKMYNVPEEMQVERYNNIKEQEKARKASKEEQIRFIVEKTGWSEETAAEDLKLLYNETGLTPEEYTEFGIYRFEKEERVEKARDILAKAIKESENNEKHILSVMEKTGWSYDQVMASFNRLKEHADISYSDFDKKALYSFPEEDGIAAAKEAADKAAEIIVNKENNIKKIMNGAGWSREKTVAVVTALRNKMDMTYRDYARYELYNVPEEKLEEHYNLIRMRVSKKEKKLRKNERLIHKVMTATGWEYEDAKRKMDDAKKLCGAEYKDYYAYKFWELAPEVQKTYFTKGCANAIRKKYNVNKENFSYFMNKDKFDEVFSEFLGRAWCRNRDVSFDEFSATFKDESKIMYKPLSASCGSGITILPLGDEMKSTYDKIMDLPIGIVEGVLVQHPEMSKFSKNAVNTIRLISINDGNDVNVIYGAFRMAGGDAVVDNFHNGGVLAILDTETGKVITDAIDLSGHFYEKHPATGEVIKGFQVPYWTEITEMIKKAGKIVDGVGYVGWDIAVTEKGPVLIEGNTAPAPNVLQLPFAKEHKGMRYVVEKYL